MPTFRDSDNYSANQKVGEAKVKTSQKNTIEKRIEELNLSISKIARDLKKSRNLVYKWIRDPESMTVKDARILAAYLSCPLCDIVMDFNSSFCRCYREDGNHEK